MAFFNNNNLTNNNNHNDIPDFCVPKYVEILEINLGSVEQKHLQFQLFSPRGECLARPPSPADVIAPSPKKDKTEDETPVCVYRIPKIVKFIIPEVL